MPPARYPAIVKEVLNGARFISSVSLFLLPFQYVLEKNIDSALA